jgi:hypothetical protein
VGAITNGAEWDWPTAPSIPWMEVKNATPGDFKPNPMRDYFLQWGGDPSGRFSVKSAWESIRSRGPEVEWHRVVWHKKAIPPHAIILWLAVRNRLNTQDKLCVHGIISEVRCVLCGQGVEDLDHLFFSCPFSERLWLLLCDKCNLPWIQRSWVESVGWMIQNSKGKSLKSLIYKRMFAASVYAIWRERNTRTFQDKARHVSSIVYEILFWIRVKCNTLHGLSPSQENRWLQRSWGISEDVFWPW